MTWLCTDKHITVAARCLEPSFEDIELAKNLKNFNFQSYILDEDNDNLKLQDYILHPNISIVCVDPFSLKVDNKILDTIHLIVLIDFYLDNTVGGPEFEDLPIYDSLLKLKSKLVTQLPEYSKRNQII